MDEYIARGLATQAVISAAMERPDYLTNPCIGALVKVPNADVVRVRHGEWVPSPDGIHPIKCSECDTIAPYRYETNFTHDLGIYPYKANYCPNCGAKMNGKDDD